MAVHYSRDEYGSDVNELARNLGIDPPFTKLKGFDLRLLRNTVQAATALVATVPPTTITTCEGQQALPI